MKQRMLVRLLCLALALLLPLTALAESAEPSWMDKALEAGKQIVTTVTIIPGEDSSQEQAMADLCNAVSLQIIKQGDNCFSIALLLDNQNALSATVRADEAGLYAQTAAISKDVMFFSWDDLATFLEETMKDSSNGNAVVSSYQIDMLRTAFLNDETEKSDMTNEEVDQAILQSMVKDESYLKWAEYVLARAVITEGDFTDPSHDPATEKTELVMTQDDIISFMDTQYAKDIVKQMLMLMGESASLTDAELDAKIDEYTEEIKAVYAKMTILIPMTMLTNQDDLVSMTVNMTGQGTETKYDSVTETSTEEPYEMAMSIDYNRLTAGGNVAHSFQMAVMEAEKSVFAVDGVWNQKENGNWDANALFQGESASDKMTVQSSYATADNQTDFLLKFVSDDKEEYRVEFTNIRGEDATDGKLDLYYKEKGADDSEQPVITFNLHTAAQDAGDELAALVSATPDSSKQLLKMVPADLVAFEKEASSNLMKAVYGLLSMLPASTLEMFSSTSTVD